MSSDNSQLTWDIFAIFVLFAKEVEKKTIQNNLNTGLLLSSFLNICLFLLEIYDFFCWYLQVFILEFIAYGWKKSYELEQQITKNIDYVCILKEKVVEPVGESGRTGTMHFLKGELEVLALDVFL